MPSEPHSWIDPRTLIAIGGLAIGILGFLFGIFRDNWSRRESRLDALGKILQPLVRAGQDLMKANNCRKRCEQLKHSFPKQVLPVIEGIEQKEVFPTRTLEVDHRLNSMIEEYGLLLKSAEKNFRDAEVEFGTRHFRFPTAIAKQVKESRDTLSELGRLVNDGLFDRADLKLAVFCDQFKRITDTAKGWRLADPFEGLLERFRGSDGEVDERQSEFELTDKEMEGVMELLHKRVTTQASNTFAIHPPKKLLEKMSILDSDSVIDELKDTVFSIVFQDGTARMLTLPELMAFIFCMITFAKSSEEVNRMANASAIEGPCEYKISYRFSMQEIMTIEMVKTLLGKIKFSETPSDS